MCSPIQTLQSAASGAFVGILFVEAGHCHRCGTRQFMYGSIRPMVMAQYFSTWSLCSYQYVPLRMRHSPSTETMGNGSREKQKAGHFFYLSAPPVTVNVFPDPVCPYANTVELYPLRTLETAPFPILANTSSCTGVIGIGTCAQRQSQFSSGRWGGVYFSGNRSSTANGCLESQL